MTVKVLLVDDDALNLRSIARAVGRFVFPHTLVLTTADGVDDAYQKVALAHATGSPFDVVLTDIDMLDGTGFDLARRLQACPPSPPAPRVVFMSALPSEERQAEARRLCGVFYDKMDLSGIAAELTRTVRS